MKWDEGDIYTPDEKLVRENIEKTEQFAKQKYPNETWVNPQEIKFKHTGKEYEIPTDLKNIKISKTKLTEGDELALAKELRQSHLLTQNGDCVYLLPREKDTEGNFISSYDAILNGVPYEFKTVDGNLKRVEKNFRDSREQSENVFIRITDTNISKDQVINKIHGVLNNNNYTGGTNGWLILHMDGTKEMYKIKISRLK